MEGRRGSHAVLKTPTAAVFQRMDQTFDCFSAKIDTVSHTIALRNLADTASHGTLSYQRPTADRLLLDGDLSGRKVQLVMSQHDLDKFRRVSRGFHWVQELPVNR
jgi:hypothetical protein